MTLTPRKIDVLEGSGTSALKVTRPQIWGKSVAAAPKRDRAEKRAQTYRPASGLDGAGGGRYRRAATRATQTMERPRDAKAMPFPVLLR